MSNSTTELLHLKAHEPLSDFDRDMKLIAMRGELRRFRERVAKFTAAIALTFLLTTCVVAATGFLGWRAAGATIGAGLFLIGLGRVLVELVATKRVTTWADRNRSLDVYEIHVVTELLRRHAELEPIVVGWQLETEELSRVELSLLRRYGDRAGKGGELPDRSILAPPSRRPGSP